MPLVAHDAAADTRADADAIDAFRRSFDAQRVDFLAHPQSTLEERKARIGTLALMMMGNREPIRRALRADFGAHDDVVSDLVECLGVAGRAQYALEHLPAWTADEERSTDPAVYGDGRAFVRYQPKGVIGNMAPWNFPFDIGVGPVVEMLAAGNRVIVKPSDFTPACGELLADMVRNAFDPLHLSVATGGVELARTFPTLPWDHLLYTGSPNIGREVMKAAAANLTPVTLELGGKCPAFLLDDGVDERSIANVLATKTLKNGQMCVSVDYVLVPRARMGAFVDLARRYMVKNLDGYSRSAQCTAIITERHLDRLIALRQQAVDAGYDVVDLEDGATVDRATRQMPLSLVLDPGDELGLMQEEIFGPLLPVKPYDDLADAIAYVNAGERPHGLYVLGGDASAQRVLDATTSGGACVNACALQGALPSLGFGGVGTSGLGRHHGVDGFREFSNPRGVFRRGTSDMIDVMYPPYGDAAIAMADAAFAQVTGPV